MKQKQLRRLLRRKSIRRRRIRRCEERQLMRRGAEDFANGIVRKNKDQEYSSPFLKQEMSLCLVQINAEKQMLAEIISFYKNEITQKDVQVEGLRSCLNDIDIPENPADSSTIFRYNGEESMADSAVQSLRISEYYQKLKTRQQQKANIDTNIKLLEISQNEYEFAMHKEMEITKYRCLQHYNLLLARLSAYWNGVLKAKTGEANDIPPMFFIKDLLRDIQSEIDQLGTESNNYG